MADAQIKPGDKVDVDTGERGVVTHVDGRRVVIELDSGESLSTTVEHVRVAMDMVDVCLPDGTQVEIDPSGDEVSMARAPKTLIAKPHSNGGVLVVNPDGSDTYFMNRKKALDWADAAGFHLVTPEGRAFQISGDEVSMARSATCPYCRKTVAMERGGSLGDHRAYDGFCDGSGRKVARFDSDKRAVFANMETFVAKAVGHTGNVLGEWEASSVEAAMARADSQAPKAADVVVRGEKTSDGSDWGRGRGRVVATRESGRWSRL